MKSSFVLAFVLGCNWSIDNFCDEIKSKKCVTTAGEMVCLKKSFWLGNQTFGTELYVRQCYIDLSVKIKEVSEDKFKPYPRGVSLMGTPGIGKSQFLSYLFWYLYANCEDSIDIFIITFVWIKKTVIIFRNKPQIEMFPMGVGILDDKMGTLGISWKKTVYLYDSGTKEDPTPVPEQLHGFLVAACSPSAKCKAFTNSGVLKLYMPVWTWEELDYVNKNSQAFYCDDNLLRELFLKVGGMFRSTLAALRYQISEEFPDKKSYMEAMATRKHAVDASFQDKYKEVLVSLSEDIKRYKIGGNGTLITAGHDLNDLDNTSLHHLQHYKVIDDYKGYESVLASDYVRSQLFAKVDQATFIKHMAIIADANQDFNNVVMRGWLFENYVHYVFMEPQISLPTCVYKKTNNDAYKLEKSPVDETFKCIGVQLFSGTSLVDISGKGKVNFEKHGLYCKPDCPNFPAVHSIILPSQLFLFTIKAEHPLSDKSKDSLRETVKILRKKDNAIKIVYYFVVPLNGYAKFKVEEDLLTIVDEIRTVGIDCTHPNVREIMKKSRGQCHSSE